MFSWKEGRIIKKEFLHNWLINETLSYYSRNKNQRDFGNIPRIMKVVKILKLLSNGSLLIQLSDSSHSIFSIITSECISNFEELNHCRITEIISRDRLILITGSELEWLPLEKFMRISDDLNQLNEFRQRCNDCFSVVIIKIEQVDIFDYNETEGSSSGVKMIYECEEYRKIVRPIEILPTSGYRDF